VRGVKKKEKRLQTLEGETILIFRDERKATQRRSFVIGRKD